MNQKEMDQIEFGHFGEDFYDWLDLTGQSYQDFKELFREQGGRCFRCSALLGRSTNMLDLKGVAGLYKILLCVSCMDELDMMNRLWRSRNDKRTN